MRDDKRMPRSEEIEDALVSRIRDDLHRRRRPHLRVTFLWIGLVAATTTVIAAVIFVTGSLDDDVNPCVNTALTASPTPDATPSPTSTIVAHVASQSSCHPQP